LAISKSELGAQELLAGLTGDNGTLALDYLEEIDGKTPSRTEAQILKKAYSIVRNPVLSFQIKKSLRLAAFRLKNTKFKVSLEGMEKLLKDPARIDDLALAIATVEPAEAFMAADLIRQANWQNFATEILPSFCRFFKFHGGIQDSNALQELTRHPDPTVITAALSALEKIDPENLQGIIVPLLNSPLTVVKAQAIQAFYRWNKHQALQHLLKMLFSKNEQDVILALHHANYFPYAELESHLIRLLTEVTSPPILMRISQIFKNNANPDLPFRIYWVNRSLEGQHQSLVKGILLGVVRSLADKKLIDISAQEYLNQLKEKVRKEELELIKKSCKIEGEADSEDIDSLLPSIEETQAPPRAKSQTIPEKQPRVEPPIDFSTYDSLKEQEKVQFLARIKAKDFKEFNEQIVNIYNKASGKELAAIVNLFGKFGGEAYAEKVKKHIKSDNPDIICAVIKALGKLDSEFLCLYLPQFMQDRNGKIRMTATRTFVTIDRESIKSLLTSLLTSPNVKQRSLAISTSMLVDFNIVRSPLIETLAKENSVELLEKIGMVLAANPDREVLLDTYRAYRRGKQTMKAEFKQIVEMVADKLSIVLNKINTAEELLSEAEALYEEEIKAEKKKSAAKDADKASDAPPDGAEIGITKEQLATEDQSIQTILTSDKEDPKTKRAKATVIIWILVAVAWGGTIALVILKLLTGE
jgi:HEAT repeat protein